MLQYYSSLHFSDSNLLLLGCTLFLKFLTLSKNAYILTKDKHKAHPIKACIIYTLQNRFDLKSSILVQKHSFYFFEWRRGIFLESIQEMTNIFKYLKQVFKIFCINLAMSVALMFVSHCDLLLKYKMFTFVQWKVDTLQQYKKSLQMLNELSWVTQRVSLHLKMMLYLK